MKKKLSFKNLKELHLSADGLTKAEVELQKGRYGKNEIVEVSKNPWVKLVQDTFKDPMIWFLFIIGASFLAVAEYQESVVLFLAMIPLIFMDAFLHRRIQASTASLRSQLATTSIVIRDGIPTEINSEEVVPGDIVKVSVGEFIPADGVFESAKDLQIDESTLTGESLSVKKKQLDPNFLSLLKSDEQMVDSNTLGFAGTRVLSGVGLLRVIFTGKRTSYGEIVQSVKNLQQERTPLQISIAGLVKKLIYAAAAFCLILAGLRIYQGHGWLDALLSSATLAVAAIPEEFPIVFTFFLGVGVYRLAKKKALVRRAVSVENIGRVTAICTDKTGTITLGQLKLVNIDTAQGIEKTELVAVAAAASQSGGTDPVDLAIWESQGNGEMKVPEKFQEFPFTEERKREAVFVYDINQQANCYVKGAPETVLYRCRLSDKEKEFWLQRTSEWALQGNKVLACARKILDKTEIDQKKEPDLGFSFLGLLIFADPPRPEVSAAIDYCNKNSIGVWMITGDHIETGLAIARNVGLVSLSGTAISAEIHSEKFNQHYLINNPEFLLKNKVIARCNPMQKLEIVNALRQLGNLVAVTGDGVNDVPALKASDIGIAMGDGAQNAKEVSSIILLDNNFSTIVNAIKEGRQLFLNLKMSFVYLLLIHIPLVLTAAIIPLMGFPLLYLPKHIVWLELIIHPTALFAFMQEIQKDSFYQSSVKFSKMVFFSKAEIFQILFAGLFVTLAITLSFVFNYIQSASVVHARTQALTLLILWGASLVFYITHLKSRQSVVIFSLTVVSTLLMVQTPALAKVLSLLPLHLSDWLSIFSILGLFLILFSLRQKTERKKKGKTY